MAALSFYRHHKVTERPTLVSALASTGSLSAATNTMDDSAGQVDKARASGWRRHGAALLRMAGPAAATPSLGRCHLLAGNQSTRILVLATMSSLCPACPSQWALTRVLDDVFHCVVPQYIIERHAIHRVAVARLRQGERSVAVSRHTLQTSRHAVPTMHCQQWR